MPGLNGESTPQEVNFYKRVLAKARELHRLRSVSPPDMTKIQSTKKEMVDLINSEPQNRFWTRITGNPLKEATDLLQGADISTDIHRAIEEHLLKADHEARVAEKESIERNPFNQIMDAVVKKNE